MANHTPDTSPSILDRVRSRVSGWFSPGTHAERQGNTNGNLRRRRDSDTETSGELSEAPPVKKLKSYIVTQTPGVDPRGLTSNFTDTSTPTTSGFGTRRTFLDYSSRPPEPYNFLRSTPLVRHPPTHEVVPEVDEEEDADEAPARRSSSDEEASIANGNDTASESGASMSSASMNIFMKRQSSVINFGSHLQSKKSLFSDKNISMSMSSLNSLSQKRSFNASLYGSTSALSDSRLLNIQSPFYRGRTMFGGASAYASRPSRQVRPSSSLSNFSSSSTSQANASAGRDEVPLSNTAKRIFEVMNQLSGPLSDVRKMAHSSLTSRPQRFTEQDMQANRAVRLQTPKTPYSRTPTNCVAPMTELQVPSMSQLLQMKKLQSQTEELRKCALDSSSALNRVTEYKLPDTKDQEGKQRVNKMRNKITKVRQEVPTDDVVEEVKLPDVQLPEMKSVPKFDITFPAVEKRNGPTAADTEKPPVNGRTFKFSQPIVVGEASFSEIQRGNFKFSEPLDVKEKCLPRKPPQSSLPMFSYAPEMAKKRPQITVTDTEDEKSPAKSLKVGTSVLEALKSSPLKPVEPPKIVNSFGSQFKAPSNTWECDSCLVRNKESDDKCVACGGGKGGVVKATPAPPATTVPADSGFKALMVAQNAKWECSGCLLKNDNALQKCPCCEQARPGALKTSTATEVKKDEGFSKLVTQQKAKWECTACMTRNESNKMRCACCDQAKPGAAVDNVPQFSFSSVPSTSKYVFGMPPAEKSEATSSTVTTASGGFVFGSSLATTTAPIAKESEKTTKEPPAPKGGFVFGNVSTTASSASPEGTKFIFGTPKTATTTESTGKFVFGAAVTTSTVSVATTSAATVTSSTGGFKFGVPATVSSAESSVTPKAPPTFTFGAGNVTVSKASEPPPVTPVVSSTNASPKASIVFGTPTTTAATANLFGSSSPAVTASPFSGGATESSAQAVFKSPMTFGEAAAAKKPIEFGTAAKATNQPFTFGAGAASASTTAPTAFTQTAVTTSVPTTQSAVFTFGAAATEAKPSQQAFIFGPAKPQEVKPQTASTGFQGFGGFQQPAQNPPAFGSVAAAPTFGSTAAQSPFSGGSSNAGFGNTAGFGSSPTTNLFGSANASTAFNASPAAQPAANMFGALNKPAAVASPFSGGQGRGFDVNDGIEPSTKKTHPSFDFGTPKAADSQNAPFTFGANNNNAPANQPDNKPAFNFSAGQTPNFNFTGSSQQNTSQPFSFNATPAPFNFETGSTETGTNAPAFQFGGTTNLFAVTPGQQPRRKMRATRRVQR